MFLSSWRIGAFTTADGGCDSGRDEDQSADVCRGKKVISFKSGRKLFRGAKVSPFYITEIVLGETLVAGKLHLRDNFSNYYQMANGQSLCFPWTTNGGRGVGRGGGVSSRSLRRARAAAHNTRGDKPRQTVGKSIFDRTLDVFRALARALRGQRFRSTVQQKSSSGTGAPTPYSSRTIALTSSEIRR